MRKLYTLYEMHEEGSGRKIICEEDRIEHLIKQKLEKHIKGRTVEFSAEEDYPTTRYIIIDGNVENINWYVIESDVPADEEWFY